MKTVCWRWDPVSPNTSRAGCPEPGFGSRAIPPASCSTPFRSLQPSNPTPRRKRSSPKNSAVATGSGSTTVFTELFGRFAENGSLENESGPQGRSQRPARSRPRDSYLRDSVGVRAPLDRRDRGQLPQATCRTLSAPASDRRRDRRPLRRSAGRPARRKASDPHGQSRPAPRGRSARQPF